MRDSLVPPASDANGSRLISTVVSPAVRLWLRSQAERVDALQVTIAGGDRQLLSGYVPRIFLAAQHIVYQGLHLSQMQVIGEQIRVNLGQVIRGKPLRLLEVVPVAVELSLSEADLNASLRSELLRAGVADLLTKLFQAQRSLPLPEIPASSQAVQLQHSQIAVAPGRVTLQATVTIANHAPVSLVLQAGVIVQQGHQLCLVQPCLLENLHANSGEPIAELDGFCIDLGPEVDIQTLTLATNQLTCQGRINVVP